MVIVPGIDARAEVLFALIDATTCAVVFASADTPVLAALLRDDARCESALHDDGRLLSASEQPRACVIAQRALPRTKLRVSASPVSVEAHVTIEPVPERGLSVLIVEQDTRLERESFLAVAAHELKSPMTSLYLELERLRRRLHNGTSVRSDEMEDELDRLLRQVRRLTRLTQGFLDASRMQSGLFSLELDRHDLCSVVREVIDSLQPLARRAKCQLSVLACSPLPLVSDGLRLEQVIHNLVVNALKYGAAGGAIEVELARVDSHARLLVRDRGPGVEASGREAIFEPFQRLSSHHVQQSLGLGLYVVREIVAAHEGRVWVEDTEGGGATFVVELPLTHSAHGGES